MTTLTLPRRVAPLVLLAAWILSCAPAGPAGRLEVQPTEIRLGHGESRSLRLSFHPARALDQVRGTATVFVHLLHPVEKVVRTFDHRLPAPWEPGVAQAYEIDLHQSALAEPLPAGNYRLGVGIYDDGSGYRWPLETAGQEVERREYAVATVEVPEPPGEPRFTFAGGWDPVEPTANKQIVARRCVSGPATLRLSPPGEDGEVRVRLLLDDPPPGAPASLAFRIEGDCGPATVGLTEPGHHELKFPLAAAAAARGCTLRFLPPVPARRACLEVVTWRAGQEPPAP
jgi:hypothetical protein